jgi:sialate O-acetylesterase
LKQSVSTKAGNDGKWHLTLAPIAPHTGGGLVSKDKYGYVKGFALAGTDKKFFWAKAYVENKTTLVVYSDEVANPVAIRYGWADNPDDANLYNAEGLPASPFRTDSW